MNGAAVFGRRDEAPAEHRCRALVGPPWLSVVINLPATEAPRSLGPPARLLLPQGALRGPNEVSGYPLFGTAGNRRGHRCGANPRSRRPAYGRTTRVGHAATAPPGVIHAGSGLPWPEHPSCVVGSSNRLPSEVARYFEVASARAQSRFGGDEAPGGRESLAWWCNAWSACMFGISPAARCTRAEASANVPVTPCDSAGPRAGTGVSAAGFRLGVRMGCQSALRGRGAPSPSMIARARRAPRYCPGGLADPLSEVGGFSAACRPREAPVDWRLPDARPKLPHRARLVVCRLRTRGDPVARASPRWSS